MASAAAVSPFSAAVCFWASRYWIAALDVSEALAMGRSSLRLDCQAQLTSALDVLESCLSDHGVFPKHGYGRVAAIAKKMTRLARVVAVITGKHGPAVSGRLGVADRATAALLGEKPEIVG